MDYWTKLPEPSKKISDLLDWGIPEQKTGNIAVVGGNLQSFSTEAKIVEFLQTKPIQNVRLLLPDALRGKVPPVPNIEFAPSTESGSFARSPILSDFVSGADFTLISGDLSKNSATAIALSNAVKSARPLLLTRDTVDLLAESASEFIEQEDLFLVASLAQLQKLFRSLLYPRMIMLSQPLMPILETLHKFTLSYANLTIVTLHAAQAGTPGQIIVAHSGNIITIPIDHTSYSPLSLWSGNFAAKIMLMNLWNPNQPLDASTAGIFW